MLVAPSVLSANFMQLGQDIQMVEAAGAQYLHLDLMDGHFVQNLTFGPEFIKQIRPETKMKLDCHLMVSNPDQYLEQLAANGADILSVHFEGNDHIHALLQKINGLGCASSLVLNPGTAVASVTELLPLVKQVLVMTVNPGFGGQQFIASCLGKMEQLAAYRQEHGLDFNIEVDGGVNSETGQRCVAAGADVLVAGSYVFGQADPAAQVVRLLALH